jgi:hypothetical protein
MTLMKPLTEASGEPSIVALGHLSQSYERN